MPAPHKYSVVFDFVLFYCVTLKSNRIDYGNQELGVPFYNTDLYLAISAEGKNNYIGRMLLLPSEGFFSF